MSEWGLAVVEGLFVSNTQISRLHFLKLLVYETLSPENVIWQIFKPKDIYHNTVYNRQN